MSQATFKERSEVRSVARSVWERLLEEHHTAVNMRNHVSAKNSKNVFLQNKDHFLMLFHLVALRKLHDAYFFYFFSCKRQFQFSEYCFLENEEHEKSIEEHVAPP